MSHILLGVTGSVASTLTPLMVQRLREAGHEVVVVATESSLYFFNEHELPVDVWRDADEWPRSSYWKEDPIPHIDLGLWADLLLVAPLSANSLGQLALGLCSSLLGSTVRAWPRQKPLVVAPAMNSRMWHHPASQLHLLLLGLIYRLRVVKPIRKRLACGETGEGALARIEDIIRVVNRALAR